VVGSRPGQGNPTAATGDTAEAAGEGGWIRAGTRELDDDHLARQGKATNPTAGMAGR
jgi:hypothetical protein